MRCRPSGSGRRPRSCRAKPVRHELAVRVIVAKLSKHDLQRFSCGGCRVVFHNAVAGRHVTPTGEGAMLGMQSGPAGACFFDGSVTRALYYGTLGIRVAPLNQNGPHLDMGWLR